MKIENLIKIKLFKDLLRIRLIEEAIANEYVKQEMRCPVHLSIGQEAISVGVCLALRKKDYIFSTHRGHAHYLAKGGDLNSFISELYGKKTGCCQGRGGSMHIIDLSVNMMGATSIVAGSISVAVGMAFGSLLKKEDNITCVFFGDGATEEGVFSESLNFASLKNLPVLFICENNNLSVTTPIKERQSSKRNLLKIAQAHGINAIAGNGNDIESVYDITEKAANYILNQKKPYFLEFETYRFRAHCGPEYDYNLGYRSQDEVEEKMKKCPLKLYREQLLMEKVLDESTIKEIEDKILEEIKQAFDFAKRSPYPQKEDLFKDIYKTQI